MYLYVRDLCCVHMGVYLSPAFILISNMMAPSRRSFDSATTPHSSSPRSYSCPLYHLVARHSNSFTNPETCYNQHKNFIRSYPVNSGNRCTCLNKVVCSRRHSGRLGV